MFFVTVLLFGLFFFQPHEVGATANLVPQGLIEARKICGQRWLVIQRSSSVVKDEVHVRIVVRKMVNDNNPEPLDEVMIIEPRHHLAFSPYGLGQSYIGHIVFIECFEKPLVWPGVKINEEILSRREFFLGGQKLNLLQ